MNQVIDLRPPRDVYFSIKIILVSSFVNTQQVAAHCCLSSAFQTPVVKVNFSAIDLK